MKPEGIFQMELAHAFNASYPGAGNFWYKIPDLPHKHQHRKPFDIVVCRGGIFWAVETKIWSDSAPWPLDQVKPHQVEALEKCGDQGMVLVNVRLESVNFAVPMTIGEWKKHRLAGKSLSVLDLASMPGRMDWAVTGWPLEPLFTAGRSRGCRT